MKIQIQEEIAVRLQAEAIGLNQSIENRLAEILENALPSIKNFDTKNIQVGVENIKVLLGNIPCIGWVAASKEGEPYWWLKFEIRLGSRIAWHVVQELAHILNYLSVDEKLPTRFYPVSPPPHMNGGPDECLSWIIEPSIAYLDSSLIFDYLQGRLPEDYDKEESWLM